MSAAVDEGFFARAVAPIFGCGNSQSFKENAVKISSEVTSIRNSLNLSSDILDEEFDHWVPPPQDITLYGFLPEMMYEICKFLNAAEIQRLFVLSKKNFPDEIKTKMWLAAFNHQQLSDRMTFDLHYFALIRAVRNLSEDSMNLSQAIREASVALQNFELKKRLIAKSQLMREYCRNKLVPQLSEELGPNFTSVFASVEAMQEDSVNVSSIQKESKGEKKKYEVSELESEFDRCNQPCFVVMRYSGIPMLAPRKFKGIKVYYHEMFRNTGLVINETVAGRFLRAIASCFSSIPLAIRYIARRASLVWGGQQAPQINVGNPMPLGNQNAVNGNVVALH